MEIEDGDASGGWWRCSLGRWSEGGELRLPLISELADLICKGFGREYLVQHQGQAHLRCHGHLLNQRPFLSIPVQNPGQVTMIRVGSRADKPLARWETFGTKLELGLVLSPT